MKSIKVCEYSRSRSFHDDLILQDQASGERSRNQWSSVVCFVPSSRPKGNILSKQKCIYIFGVFTLIHRFLKFSKVHFRHKGIDISIIKTVLQLNEPVRGGE